MTENQEPKKEAEDESTKPLTIEERLTLLEHILVTKELATALAGSAERLGKNAPEKLIMDMLLAQRKYANGFRGLTFMVMQRVANAPNNAGQEFASMLLGLVNGITEMITGIEKRIRVGQSAASSLVGPDGKPI